MENSKEFINITDIFEYAINNLHTMPAIQRNLIAANIVELEYIDKLIARDNSQRQFEGVVKLIANGIVKKDMPVDVFQLSAFVYKGRQAGYNVEPLVLAMNENGEWLKNEQLKSM